MVIRDSWLKQLLSGVPSTGQFQNQQQKQNRFLPESFKLPDINMPSTETGMYDFSSITPTGLLGQPASQPSETRPHETAAQTSMQRAGVTGLESQIEKQRLSAQALGEEPEEPGPTVLERIFDVLLRTNYAMAEQYRVGREMQREGRAATSGLPKALQFATLGTDVSTFPERAKAAWKGFSGKEKTFFSDVLEQEGVENKWIRGVGGLTADILADPLTYVGIAPVKAVSKSVAAGKGLKAAETVAKSPEFVAVGQEAVKAAIRSNKGKFLPKKKLTEIENTAKGRFLFDAYKDAEIAAIKAGGGSVNFNYFGRTFYSSEKLYAGFARLGRATGITPGSRALVDAAQRAFRPTYKYHSGVNQLKRMAEGKNIADLTVFEKELRRTFRKTTEADRKTLTYALEHGTDLTGKIGKEGADLGEMQKAVREILDEFGQEAIGLGILEEGQLLANYIPHIYRNADQMPKVANRFRRARKQPVIGTEKPGFTKTRKIPTLEDATAAGLDPVLDIQELLVRRSSKHFQARAQIEFMDGLAARFGFNPVGAKLTKSERKLVNDLGLKKVTSEAFENPVYFLPEIKKIIDNMDVLGKSVPEFRKIMRNYDSALNGWKSLATVINPGHHFRNIGGDIFLNYLDGVHNPLRYSQSAKLLWAVSPLTKTNPDKVFFKVGNAKLTAREIWQVYLDTGAKTGFFFSELGRPSNIAMKKVRQAAELREDFGRMAHFIDALKKEGGNLTPGPKKKIQLEQAAIKAGDRVKKFNFDYGDFTDFEKKVMKRIIPFYSWLRKNLPLQIEALALTPGLQANIPKAQSAVETLLGVERDDLMIDRMPRWIREQALAQLSGGEEPLFGGAYLLPIHEIGRFGGGPKTIIKELLGSSAPWIKAPMELGTDTQLFSGAPLPEAAEYGAQQVPIARMLYNQFKGEAWEDPRRKKEAWINYLTGAGLQRATYERQRGELRRQQDPIQRLIREARSKNREELFGPGF